MDALGRNGGFWWNFSPQGRNFRSRRRSQQPSDSHTTGNGSGGSGGNGSNFKFPMKQALTATSLALTGDTIAQLTNRWKELDRTNSNTKTDDGKKNTWTTLVEEISVDILTTLLSKHDWLRALRMSSYGFLLYGPGSYAWYQYLDHSLPKKTVQNLVVKVILNQIVLGPCVIAVIFAWNNLWLGKVSELPRKYQKDALPTLLYGLRFWVPVSILNFGLVPLQTRVAFMSTCSIFWNFYLSSTMNN